VADIAHLERQVHRARLLNVVALTVVVVVSLVGMARPTQPQPPPADITARSLTIVDDRGTARLVLSATLPNPRVGGREFPRSVVASGIQFNDGDGNEVGGLALLEAIRGMALCFDYATAEAACLTKIAGTPLVGLTLLGPPADSAAVGVPGPERVVLGFEAGTTRLTLGDSVGRTRIRLVVPPSGRPRLEFLAVDGSVLSSMPRETAEGAGQY